MVWCGEEGCGKSKFTGFGHHSRHLAGSHHDELVLSVFADKVHEMFKYTLEKDSHDVKQRKVKLQSSCGMDAPP